MLYRTVTAAGLTTALAAALLTTGAWAGTAPATALAADPPAIPESAPMEHIQGLQKVADANGGNRAHGRPGFKASIDYVKGQLDAAGFTTTVQNFTHNGATGYNLIADWPQGDPSNVVFLGAHLDSVPAGPGINDDGSGTSAQLAVALQVAKSQLKPTKRLRFGWWGAEELGLVGSAHYTKNLPADERKKINVYLNFDMVGAKGTSTWGVYEQSAEYNAVWKDYFTSKNVPTRNVNYGDRSDHGSFLRIGVKVSGIGSGSDSCYHKACDTTSNVDAKTMGITTNAIAHVTWKLAGATR
ncbi:aminopeptidase [Pilimelia terevasa]|uniref:Aminopeptidase n=1 Tax=Pilimelia terevasa TaxID=53372 RepID=A0A8J3FF57_9ACTN|nr:M28 family peptidase [Pilimelia terevasa]GGK16656.1 aminopeptidase [Pilimelia terevasa]